MYDIQHPKLEDMTHSNIFKPQGMFHSSKLHFEATPLAQRLRGLARPFGKSRWAFSKKHLLGFPKTVSKIQSE